MSIQRIGRYELESTLGRGAMGVVYLARDPIIGRKVALKTLRLDLDEAMADEFRERFIREARAAGRLNHPGLVTIHDVGEDKETGLVFIAMEYLTGRNLKDIMAAGQRFRPAEAARIAADLALALDYAHSMKVVHRDIKPANIILTNQRQIKITDFGVARLESSNLTVQGQFIGTPNFMSPEQVRGETIDGRSDIFSLGVVLFELLTAQRPFSGDTMHEVTMKIVQAPTPIPSTLCKDLPPAFNPIVMKCLMKDPAKRFQTGGELAQVLGALADSLGPQEQAAAAKPKRGYQTGTMAQKPAQRATGRTAVKPTIRPRTRSQVRRLGFSGLPAPLTRDVGNAWLIIACVAVFAFGSIAWFGLQVRQSKNQSLAAPSAASTLNLHGTAQNLQNAEASLRIGDQGRADLLCRRALDQAPASPAARSLKQRIADYVPGESDRESLQDAGMYDLPDFLGEPTGRDEPRVDHVPPPLDEPPPTATPVPRLVAGRRATPVVGGGAQQPTGRRGQTTRRQTYPTPAPRRHEDARLNLTFKSPLSFGSVVVIVDGETIKTKNFEFFRKVFGVKKPGSGTVKDIIMTKTGRHTILVELRGKEGVLVGSETFDIDLSSSRDWTLRIVMADNRSEPEFSLYKSNR